MRVDPWDGRGDSGLLVAGELGGSELSQTSLILHEVRGLWNTPKYQLPGKVARTDYLGLKSLLCHLLIG